MSAQPTITPYELVLASKKAGVEDVYGRAVMALRNELNDTIVYDRKLERWMLDPAKSSEVIRRWNEFFSERRARAARKNALKAVEGFKPTAPVAMDETKWKLRASALACFTEE
jgi:hypothetical protein